MRRLKVPRELRKLLDGNELGDALSQLIRASSPILADNKLPFFPHYTDHGISHVESVLRDQIQLIPTQVWRDGSLTAGDAFLIVAGTVLHDLAMHINLAGFRAIVSGKFAVSTAGLRLHSQPAELWEKEWKDFLLEARGWDKVKVADVFGAGNLPTREFWTRLPKDLEQPLCIPLIGEFVRRQHARLAYEISLNGFPGITGEEFPKLKSISPGSIGELAGFVARSHHYPIRDCARLVNERFESQVGPNDSHPVFAMVLLRISDYLQIAADRAPEVLLSLRTPPSPLSMREWRKHQLLFPVSFSRADTETLYFGARNIDPAHEIFVSSISLLNDLQRELDESNATLRECYPNRGSMSALRIAFSRVASDLSSKSYLGALPFVERDTGVTIDRKIVSLLAQPLYGDRPEYAIRELIQNATDAVNEMQYLESPETLHRQWHHSDPEDVQVCLEEYEGKWRLNVSDRGIGMKEVTITDYLLRVGASFRESIEWKKLYRSGTGELAIARSGRFGIGIFSTFLLGPEVRVETRHMASDVGFSLCLAVGKERVELRKESNLPFGTKVSVSLAEESVKKLGLAEHGTTERLDRSWDWWCWDRPKVGLRLNGKLLNQNWNVPRSEIQSHTKWREISHPDFEKLYWSVERDSDSKNLPNLVCNGIRIGTIQPGQNGATAAIANTAVEFPRTATHDVYRPIKFQMPFLSIVDKEGNLDLKSSRAELTFPSSIQFHAELETDIAMDFVAYCLVNAPAALPCLGTLDYNRSYPLHSTPLSIVKLGINPAYRLDGPTSNLDEVNSDELRWCTIGDRCMPFIPRLIYHQSFEYAVWFGRGTAARSQGLPFLYTQVPTVCQSTLNCLVGDDVIDFGSAPDRFFEMPFFCRLLRQLAGTGVPGVGKSSQLFAAAIGRKDKLEYSTKTALGDTTHVVVNADTNVIRITSTDATPPPAIEMAISQFEELGKQILGIPNFDCSQVSQYLIWAKVDRSCIEPEPNVVCKKWEDFVGLRGIPLDPTERRQVKERAIKKDGKFAEYVRKWEKSLQTV